MKTWEIPANDLGEEIETPRKQRGQTVHAVGCTCILCKAKLVHPEGWRSDGQMADQGRKI